MTVREILTAAFNYWWEGMTRVGYGLGGICPPEQSNSKDTP